MTKFPKRLLRQHQRPREIMNESELLFTQVLGCDRVSLYLNKDVHLTPKQSALISSSFVRRIKGEPLQYIIGKTEFMGLEFKVNKDVLIPRPETEILVETLLSYLGTPLGPKLRVSPPEVLTKYGDTLKIGAKGVPRLAQRVSLRVLDMCTASGCIAISIAKRFPQAEIVGVDISEGALRVAKENAQINKVKVNFLHSRLFESLSGKFDFIVSNPPYVPNGQIKGLQPEIKHEPFIALNGGDDGLEFYRKIIKDSQAYLNDNGILMMEIGFGQKDPVEKLIDEVGFQLIEIVKDYNDIERVVVAKKGRKNG